MTPFISICIPAYKRVEYLKRLLDSIIIQGYKNFEVVITDDTPGDEVKEFCALYKSMLPLQYYKNKKSLGTPENWNEAIRKASGQWIKIMHDDDWFSGSDGLREYADAIVAHPEDAFFFAAYTNIYEQENNRQETIHLSRRNETRLKQNPLVLFRKNFIGNPSCTLFKKDEKLIFDSGFKWVVDFEFYIRYLEAKGGKLVYIDKSLVNLSVNSSQVTKYTFGKGNVVIPENQVILDKMGPGILKNILVYDHFWRLYRNTGVRSPSEISEYGYSGTLHPVLLSMIRWQRFFPLKLLRIGVFSKALMILHYCTHFFSIK
jgi:glycosyltransferase involved in cell wall biosynthesis